MSLETLEDVKVASQKIINKKIKELLLEYAISEDKEENKGYVGHIIEECLGIKKNNVSAPDIAHLGLEVKAIPLKKVLKKKGTKAELKIKERMVLNIINFNKENLDDFYQSSFFKKNNNLLIFFYIYDKEINKKDYFIYGNCFHFLSEIPTDDLEIIKNDWKIITDKIKAGKAEELSERLTTYLGACTKGNKTITSQTTQPFSNLKATRRAYSFKIHYLNYLFLKTFYPEKISDLNIKNNESIVNFIYQKLKPWSKYPVNELCSKFNINYKAKHRNYLLLQKILNVRDINYVKEFLKENIKVRTYSIEENDRIQEHFPFLKVDPNSFVGTDNFYDSDLYNLFISKKFIFIGFKLNANKQSFINRVSYFEFPEKEIEELKKIWEDTRVKFLTGINFYKKGKKEVNNLIAKSDPYIGHVRPRAADKKHTYLTPYNQEITKQCYWLNKNFVEKYLKNLLIID